jgi:hypothetical protein
MSYSNITRAIGAQTFSVFTVTSNLNGVPDDDQVWFAGNAGPSNAAGGQAFNFSTLGYTGNRAVEMSIIPRTGAAPITAGYQLDINGNPQPFTPKIYYRLMGGTTIQYTTTFLAGSTQTYRFGMSVSSGLEIAGEGFVVLRFTDIGVEIARIPYSFATF